MKLNPVFAIALSTLTFSAVGVSFSGLAQAITFAGNSSGTWGTPDPGTFNSDPGYTGVGTNRFTWGLPLPDNKNFGTPANSLTFNGTSFKTDFDSLFKIGDLTYFNGTVPLYTNVEKVPLNLSVSFQNPSLIAEVFEYNFNLVNTRNDSSNPEDNADFVFPSPAAANRSFTYNGNQYTLELTGFSQDEGATSAKEFRVLEGATTTAAIYGKITSARRKVPEPHVILGLCAMGGYMFARKKNLRAKT
jgi:hypothetical protein